MQLQHKPGQGQQGRRRAAPTREGQQGRAKSSYYKGRGSRGRRRAFITRAGAARAGVAIGQSLQEQGQPGRCTTTNADYAIMC